MTGQFGRVLSACAIAAASLVILLLCGSSRPIYVRAQSDARNVKGGYYIGGTSGLFPSLVLDATLYTHLFYAFGELNANTSSVTPNEKDVVELSMFSANMKAINPHVLTLISVLTGSDQFALVLQSQASRSAFINSSISLARSFNLDGIDLDWEFPKTEGNMTALASFLTEWREAVVTEAEQSCRAPLLLTAAVYYASNLIYSNNISYPIAALAENLDLVNIMTYDFHGPSWGPNYTGANSILYDPDSVLNADYGVRTWLEAGLPADKIVLGLTLYGRSWTLKNQSADAGLKASAIGEGPPQPRSNTSGVFYYFEVSDWISRQNVTVVHDLERVTAYGFADDTWVSYEDPDIITTKVLYATTKGLRGYFFWSVGFDDNWEISRTASETLDKATLPTAPP